MINYQQQTMHGHQQLKKREISRSPAPFNNSGVLTEGKRSQRRTMTDETMPNSGRANDHLPEIKQSSFSR